MMVVWRMVKASDPINRAGLAMIGMVLVTPYIHNYDLNLLSCACILALRPKPANAGCPKVAPRLIIYAFMVPILVMYLNPLGIPLSPLLMLPLVVLL
ncbi:MAG: hypothetical protein MO852_02560 [Candidatus Devosia euplotis]|nr:hypothetical protein [Candidatus Devosia euplotis]